MRGIADRRSNPAQQNLPRIFHPSETIHNVRRLIWLYLWLLVFEGVLRKWFLPQFSAPLLLVRDPVVLLIYLLALRARIFPCNIYILSLASSRSFLGNRYSCSADFPLHAIILVTGYGVRSNFLHLPFHLRHPGGLRFGRRETRRLVDRSSA